MTGIESRLRSVFISDLHLGSRGCRVDALLQFLNALDTENLFLIGDIVDLWRLKRKAYWPAAHGAVIQRLLSLARAGTRVVLVPGNHDADLREFADGRLGGIEVHRNFVHRTAAGRRLLLLHGDEFDGRLRCHPWLESVGGRLYDLTIALNRQVNTLRLALGLSYWSLAGDVKQRIARAMQHIDRFEHAVIEEARRRRLDGAVCGHIHRAQLRAHDDLLYCNDGDWVETCSAVVERPNGELRLWRCAATQRSGAAAPQPLLEGACGY